MNSTRVLAAALAFALLTAASKKKAEPPPPQPVQFEYMQAAVDRGLMNQLKTLIERAKLAKQDGPELAYYTAEYYLGTRATEAAFAQFLAVDGGDPRIAALARQGAGIAAYRLGRTEEAVTHLLAATEADPTLVRAWAALGAAADRRQDFALSERAYAEALRLVPDDAVLLSNRGYSRVLQRRAEDAIADLTRAVTLAPTDARIRNNLRIALALSGRYGEAMAGVEPREQHVHLNNIGYAAMLRGDFAEAESYFNQALERSDSYYAPAQENLRTLEAMKARQQALTPGGAPGR